MTLEELASFRWLTAEGAAVALGRVAMAVAVVAAAWFITRLIAAALDRLKGRPHVSAAFLYLVRKLVSYGVVALGLLVALSTLGIDLTSLAVFAGAVGVGVGLGLQGVVREFVSGLVVIFDQNVQVGDFVELDNGVRGEVVEVGPRASRIRTNDAVDVVLPNSKLIESQVLNWTLKGKTSRIRVPFRVAYGSDKARVREVVLNAAKALPFTLPDTEARRTQVWLVGLGESAMNFELVVWPTAEAVRRPASMRAAYLWAIHDALCEAGIEVPLSQVDVRLRSLFGQEEQAALDALKLERPQPSPAAPAVFGQNDASIDTQADPDEVDPEGRRPVEGRA